MRHSIFVIGLLSSAAFAAGGGGHHIQLAGIPDRASFADESRDIWNALKKRGYSGKLILGSSFGDPLGDWSYAKEQTEVRKTGGGTLDLLESEARAVKPGENLVMYVGDHGISKNGWIEGGGPGNPAKTGMVMSMLPFGAFASWPDVVARTRQGLPKNSSLKIIAGPCFSGGVHAAVAKVDGACAISSSDYLSVGYSSISKDDQNFDEAVAEQLASVKFDPDKSGKTSLMEAWLYGLEKDFELSGARSGISSFDFVDSVLKEGPYHGDREELSGWEVEVGDAVNSCSNAPFDMSPIRMSSFKDFEKISQQIQEDSKEGDWNDIPEELRKIHEKAIERRGFLGDVFSARDLKELRQANQSLDDKAQSAELKAILEEWKARNDPNGPAPVREYFKILDQKGGRELLALNEKIQVAEDLYRERDRDYKLASATLRSAWFFVEKKAEVTVSANEKRLGALVDLRKLQLEKNALLSKSPGLEEKLTKAEAARNTYTAELQKKLRERYSKLRLRRPSLELKEARVAMLREKMVRVARFMKQATPAQKEKYLSLLKCELEDI
jgi:hypothetical protein